MSYSVGLIRAHKREASALNQGSLLPGCSEADIDASLQHRSKVMVSGAVIQLPLLKWYQRMQSCNRVFDKWTATAAAQPKRNLRQRCTPKQQVQPPCTCTHPCRSCYTCSCEAHDKSWCQWETWFHCTSPNIGSYACSAMCHCILQHSWCCCQGRMSIDTPLAMS